MLGEQSGSKFQRLSADEDEYGFIDAADWEASRRKAMPQSKIGLTNS